MYLLVDNPSKTLLALILILLGPASVSTNIHQMFRTHHTDMKKEEVTGFHQRQRNISANDVQAILMSVDSSIHGNLQFLFGQEYEDSVGSFKPVFDAYIELTTMENDGLDSTLDRMLRLATRTTLLVVLESPVEVIYIFKAMRRQMLECHLVRWLLVMEGDEGEASLAVLEELVTEGTEVTIFLKDAGLFRVFHSRVDTKGVTRFKRRGVWKGTIPTSKNQLAYEKRGTYSVSGRQMTVGVKESLLSITIGEVYPDGSVELQGGLDCSVLKALSSSLNFTYKTVLAPDDAWGNVRPDGSVTGIIGMIANREVSFGISILVITESRRKVADFTFPYYFSRMALLTRSPKEKTRVLAIFRTLDFKVWISIVASAFMLSPVIYIISYLRATYWKDDDDDVKGDIQWYAFNTFRSIVSQGNFIRTKAWPKRFVLFSWFLFCIVFSASYSGMLTAVLAAPAYETPIDSLLDLPRGVEEGFTLGVLEDSSSEYYFKTATEGALKQTWELFNHEERWKSFVSTPDIGLKRVLEEKFVFITGETYGHVYAWRYGQHNFHMGREKFLPVFPGIACQKGSPFRDVFTQAILRFMAGGLVDKWLKDEYRKIPRDPVFVDRGENKFSVSIVHLQAAFYLVLIGLFIAALAILMENVIAITCQATVSRFTTYETTGYTH